MASSIIKSIIRKINGHLVNGSVTSYDMGIAKDTVVTWSLSSGTYVARAQLTELGTITLSSAGTWIIHGYVTFPAGGSTSPGSRTIQLTNTNLNGTHYITVRGSQAAIRVTYFNTVKVTGSTSFKIYCRHTGDVSNMTISEAKFRAIKI